MIKNISINCHSSIKITTEKTYYFDPYCIEEKTNDADYIFVTHDHYDHLDPKSIMNIIKKDTIIIMPNTSVIKAIEQGIPANLITGVDPNEEYKIDTLEFETVPSYNTNKDFHKKEYNWVGYIVNINDKRIYVSGDTDNNEDINKVSCDIALIPIGGTYTMTKEEAATLINNIKPQEVIPTHYAKIVGNLSDGEDFKKLINEDIKCHLLIK